MTGQSHKTPPWVWAILGILLLAAGIYAALWLPKRLAAPEEASAVPVAVNFPAPDLHFTDLKGKKISLRDYRGTVVLLNNWATWCPPCRDEMPTLEKYYRRHKSQGFIVLAVAAHEYPFEIKAFLAKQSYQLTFPIIPDPDEASMTAFKQNRLPVSFVIDRNGTVRLMWIGAISGKMLERYVTPIITEK